MLRTITRLALASTLVAAAPVLAEHRYTARWQQVQETAHRLEDAARHVHREAERRAHHGSYAEQRSFVALHELADRADHFHRQVERYRQDPRHTNADFRALQDAYYRAESSLRGLHGEEHVYRDFGEVARLMDHLTALYTSWMAPYGGYRGPGYGRGGDGDGHGSYGYGAYGQWYRPGLYLRWSWQR